MITKISGKRAGILAMNTLFLLWIYSVAIGRPETVTTAVTPVVTSEPNAKQLPMILKLEKPETSFEDVKGFGDIFFQFEEVVHFFTQRKMYKQLGAKIPRGIGIFGKPGAGKALVAQAIAGEGQP